MTEYDSRNYSPAAPVGLVELTNPHTGVVLESVPMLLDTGADTTLLPRQALEQIGLTPDDDLGEDLAGFDGKGGFYSGVTLLLTFLGVEFEGKFLVLDDRHGILGRDILNNYVLLFDGPEHIWREIIGEEKLV